MKTCDVFHCNGKAGRERGGETDKMGCVERRAASCTRDRHCLASSLTVPRCDQTARWGTTKLPRDVVFLAIIRTSLMYHSARGGKRFCAILRCSYEWRSSAVSCEVLLSGAVCLQCPTVFF